MYNLNINILTIHVDLARAYRFKTRHAINYMCFSRYDRKGTSISGRHNYGVRFNVVIPFNQRHKVGRNVLHYFFSHKFP